MEKIDRHKIRREYKEREDIGGLYRYVDTANGWASPLYATPNMQGQRSKVQFAKKLGDCPEPAIQNHFNAHGGTTLEMVEIEQLKRKPDQTLPEFRADLKALLELYQLQEEK